MLNQSTTSVLPMRHNMVNILYIIKGLAEVHLDRACDSRFQTEEAALRHAHIVMRRICSQAERALSITQKMKLVIREQLSADSKESISLKDVWYEITRVFVESGAMPAENFLCRVPDNFPDILCSERDLKEILYCLCDNAIQAMRPSAVSHSNEQRLILRAEIIAKEDTPVADVTLSDTGPGMDTLTLSHLFDPFFTTKPSGEGNGLGLCVVKALVKKNGGQISVSSYPGSGTTFRLTLPITKSSS